MRRAIPLPWPRSLQGQVMVAVAIALLITQALSAWLIWREVTQRHVAALVNIAAMRMVGDRVLTPPADGNADAPRFPGAGADDRPRLPRALHVRRDPASPEAPGDRHLDEVESALRDVLAAQGETTGQVVVLARDPMTDPLVAPEIPALRARFGLGADNGRLPRLVVASARQADGSWLTVRTFEPGNRKQILFNLVRQTVLIYIALVVVLMAVLGRIIRPLRVLTGRIGAFAADPGQGEPLAPRGPEDIRRLIVAHNAMEARIVGLLHEKDVMLGAIGHDLKTPLAALRVRIESVENAAERDRMAATIADISTTLDDILSLARVGRPTDPREATELAALVGDIVGEFEDMGEPVSLERAERLVASVRATWLRRALRNLIGNAVRYGGVARISLLRDGDWAEVRVEDNGPGIPESELARMLEPFTRLESSRNSGTGGAGLGLTLARAIAEQHGGTLVLANRTGKAGLIAVLRLPLG